MFPGVQNTMHVSQETDQNCSLFKSLLRQFVQVLMNEAYREAQGNGVAASGLSLKCYGLLLSGRPAGPELGRVAIPPIFLTAFSYEKNIQSWEKSWYCAIHKGIPQK